MTLFICAGVWLSLAAAQHVGMYLFCDLVCSEKEGLGLLDEPHTSVVQLGVRSGLKSGRTQPQTVKFSKCAAPRHSASSGPPPAGLRARALKMRPKSALQTAESGQNVTKKFLTVNR